MRRKSRVAGHFYEASKKELLNQIQTCFLKGPGTIPEVTRKGYSKVKAIIVPHAGYDYSGSIASYAFNELVTDSLPHYFIIIGPNHNASGATVSIMTEGVWETPLGTVPISKESRRYCSDIIVIDELSHMYEHSIEVQLPFLQFFNHEFEFTPLCLGWHDWDTIQQVGKILSQAQDTVFIGSTDFSHIQFSKFPSEDDIKTQVHDVDMLAINEILELNAEGLVDTVRRHNITACGYGAVAVILEALKDTASAAKLLKYSTSYDVTPGTYVVGYAAIVIT